eukprot:CAMPEP_0204626732 /NCGR_PEP_ID=MMETSP0717-20131115/12555_1 /ASSEMBLY_ACC=CAM_ASM_000666 /TAXON_ID=230516 /ORGANISM="Chaetoceros curvisetus" /LENGTH=123 /DNA_ID=CAMNT_0051642773 /DNA_START=46 /DNA_END=417 /DNA_ORIENTATION=-
MADVRRDVWTSGFKGLAYGLSFGFIFHEASQFIYNNTNVLVPDNVKKQFKKYHEQLKLPPIQFNRNTKFLAVLMGGAMGSFILATTTGKNEVHNMHNIFEIGKKDPRTPYQKTVEDALLKKDE